MLRPRPGVTLAEAMVALTLTSIIGTALSGVFLSQARFLDTHAQVSSARGVSRGALNLMLNELRMLERSGGVESASDRRITLRVPYALGVVCGATGILTISRLPADPSVIRSAGYSGYAFRNIATGEYTYVAGGSSAPAEGGAPVCENAGVTIVTDGGGDFDGRALQMTPVPSPAPRVGTSVFLYQRVTYEFRASAALPGEVGLWRRVEVTGTEQEIAAPFDASARFQFYVDDAESAVPDVPAQLHAITGLELKLHGLIERPYAGGERQRMRLSTSVFFRNRQ